MKTENITEEQIDQFWGLREGCFKGHVTLDPIKESEVICYLLEKCRYTETSLAGRIGKSRSYINKRRKLIKLPDSILFEVRNGKICVAGAEEIAALIEHVSFQKVISRVSGKNLTYREIRKVCAEEYQEAGGQLGFLEKDKLPANLGNKHKNFKGLLRAEELLKLLPISVSRNAFYHTVKSESIPHFKIGTKLFFDPVEVDRWLEERHVGKRRSGSVFADGISNMPTIYETETVVVSGGEKALLVKIHDPSGQFEQVSRIEINGRVFARPEPVIPQPKPGNRAT